MNSCSLFQLQTEDGRHRHIDIVLQSEPVSEASTSAGSSTVVGGTKRNHGSVRNQYRYILGQSSRKHSSLRFDLSQIISQSHCFDWWLRQNLDLSIFDNSNLGILIQSYYMGLGSWKKITGVFWESTLGGNTENVAKHHISEWVSDIKV